MSPELLDPLRFGSSGRSTRESDCYALGMVVYEVSRSLIATVSRLPVVGFDRPPTILPPVGLLTRTRCVEG